MSEKTDNTATSEAGASTTAKAPKEQADFLSGASDGVWGLWNRVKATSETLEQRIGTYLEDVPANDSIKKKLFEWGSAAGEYIDRADKQIEEMEGKAGSYLKNVGTELRGYVEQTLQPEADQQDPKLKPVTLFNADTHITTSRLDSQLHSLHSSPDLFVNQAKLEGSIESRQTEIKDLLASNKDLRSLHESIVPVKIAEDQFWLRYFNLRDEIVEQDRKRKEIIAKQQQEEQQSWESSDEESKASTKTKEAKTETDASKAPPPGMDSDSDDWE